MKTQKLKIIAFCLSAILFANTVKAEEPNIVVDGNARFTVLTPSLIRTEYSGDGVFENKKSYNIVDHNLTSTSYTTKVNDGWREIETEKLLLRYKQNSGAFDSTNLVINLKERLTYAKPWVSTTGSSFFQSEAEKLKLYGGATTATDHKNYTGTGFVAGLKYVGAGMQWSMNNDIFAGEYIISLRYCSGKGAQTISLYIDGVRTQIQLEATADWDTWKTFTKKIDLAKGSHTFKVQCDAEDTYNVNFDWVSVLPNIGINQICEAENANLEGGASNASNHAGFSGTGFVAGLKVVGAKITWNVNNSLSAGNYTLTIKYTNGIPADNQHIARTISLYINNVKTQITLEPTADWATWGFFTKTVPLIAGQNTIVLSCDTGDSYNVNIDWLTLTQVEGELPKENIIPVSSSSNLGAWSRGLDEKKGSIPLWDGILSRDGWYLLDDSQTALQDGEGWVVDRPVHAGGYLDGYFFGYGNDYQTALKEFYKITGNPVLLPKWAFGVWYSINSETYTNAAYYKNTLLPKFRSEKLPLDVLVVDTDWKTPERWNGWNWISTNFPDPQGFMDWTKEQNLVIPLNVHPTIQNNDPRFAQTNTTAGGLIQNGSRYHFDFTNKKHTKAYFDLHEPFNSQGVRFWWFDQAETPNSQVAGVPADTWINGLYAKYANDQNLRGFAFSRIGSGHAGYSDSRTPGIAWSEHRYTLHFTGDTYNEWSMLAFQSTFTIKEANIGIPYVSHDLGSYHGNHLSDDMYMRWVQFGTFQPIFRLHSKRGERLPWQYPNVAQQATEFIRLREALVPYTYSLAHESSTGGMPIVRGMYFYYPEAAESYTFDKQYFYGEKMLVSPIVTAGATASTQVWFPEGTWINYFTNEKIAGPKTQNITADYSTMPVFVKAGGIIPLAPYSDCVSQMTAESLILKVYAGDDGEFTLYEDEGENLNYQNSKYALTKCIYKEQDRKFSIKASQGDYTGAAKQRAYDIGFYNAVIPERILVNGVQLNRIAAASGEGWWVVNDAVYIHLDKRAVTSDIEVVFNGVSSALPSEIINQEIKLYPNPAIDQFTIELGDMMNEVSVVRIYDFFGKIMFNKSVVGEKIIINAHTFAKGIYFVEIDKGVNRYTQKLIIK